jgi:DNA-binding transcriptional LysR family regulator
LAPVKADGASCGALPDIDSYEVMREMALAGFGVTFVPNYILADELRAGTLVEVLRAHCPPHDPIAPLPTVAGGPRPRRLLATPKTPATIAD